MNIVDFIIIGIFVFAMLNGYRKGFLVSLIGMFSSIVGLIAAYKCYPLLTGWVNSQYQVQEKIFAFLKEHLAIPQSVSEFKITSLATQDLDKYLDKITLPASLKLQVITYIQNLEGKIAEQSTAALGDILHQFLATLIINGLAFILIWFSVNAILSLIAALFSRATRNTVLGSLDKLGGLLLGFLVTVLSLTIIIGLVTPVLNMANIAEPSLLSAVVKPLGEAKLAPYFTSFFSFLSGKIVNLLPI